jgi:hypothetical protein
MKRLALGLIALVAACGGTTASSGDNSAACGAACGGDVVGRWKILSYCGPSTYQMTIGTCAVPATVERITATTTGTMEFLGDGTYSGSITNSGTVRLTYPAACLTIGGYTLTCAQLGTGCAAAAAGGCTCTMTANNQTSGGTGTYSINGSVLTTLPLATIGSPPSQFDYCVQGNRFTMTPRASDDAGVAFSSGVGNVLEKLP